MDYNPNTLTNDGVSQVTPRPVLTKGRRFGILAVVALSAFMYFGYTAFESATSFYLTVDELVAEGAVAGTQSLQVKGSLVEGSFSRASQSSTVATFRIQENGSSIGATYDGVLPDLFFNPHSEIVLSGTLGSDGIFATDRVLVKCPSKYQALEADDSSTTAYPA